MEKTETFLQNVQSTGTSVPAGNNSTISLDGLLDEADKCPAESLKKCRQILRTAEKNKDKQTEAQCLLVLGAAYYNLSDYKNSLANVNKALEFFRLLDDKKGIASSLNNKGRVFIEIGKYQDALENHLESLKILEKLNDSRGISKLYNNIGLIHWYCENYRMALQYHSKSLTIKKELNDRRGIARTLNNMGNAYKYLGKSRKAIECYNEALEINRQLDNPKGIAFCLNNLGTMYKDMNKSGTATDYYTRSLEIKKLLGDRQGISNTYLNLGIVYTSKCEFDKARKYYDKGSKIAEEDDLKNVQKAFYYNYSEHYLAKGDFKQAYEYLKKYTGLKDELFNEEIARRFSELQLRYDIEKMESENDLLRQKNEIQMLEIESQKHLKELNATKDKFFSIIAHDLKSPFAVMTSFLNILKRAESYDKNTMMSLINEMDMTVNASLNLLENLLEWSRSETGRIKFTPRKLKLRAIASDVISLLSGNAKSKKIKIENKIDAGQTCCADSNMLHTILRNLISNAVKFSFEKGLITVSSNNKQDVIEVCVTDNGTGIEPGRLDNIFCMDTKINTNGTMGEKGTGIGLILCREFVEKNGGSIRVFSEQGKGSTFCFTLPKTESLK